MTQSAGRTNDWIRSYHPAPQARTRLLCLPHAGGSASYYFPVSRALTPRIEVLAVQYPGRQDRRHEPCLDDIRAMADGLLPELAEYHDKPLALFGHSMGATLAFELALRLAQHGIVPEVLFASGRRAPSAFRDERAHLLDDDLLIADMKRLSGTGSEVLADDEFMRAILPAVRSDYRAAETYRYQPSPPLDCPIIALTGTDDPQVTIAEADAWREHTTAAFELHTFAGGHFFVNEHAPAVLARIDDVLAGAPAAELTTEAVR